MRIKTDCEIVSIKAEQSTSNEERCRPEIKVEFEEEQGQSPRTETAIVDKMLCSEQSAFIKKYAVGTQHSCAYMSNDASKVDLLVAGGERSSGIQNAVMAMLILLGFAFILVFCTCFFDSSLAACCPRFVLNFFVNLRARFSPDSSPPASSPPPSEEITHRVIRRPPIAASRRRISALVEATKISEEETVALCADGWSCCICLEDQQSEGSLCQSVSRLQCNHATHTECLRAWLEKGRAVCCLCNTEVFPDGLKDAAGSSGRSYGSADDREPIGSLEVERTEGAPSSPATSVFIDMSQPRSAEQRLSDEQRDV